MFASFASILGLRKINRPCNAASVWLFPFFSSDWSWIVLQIVGGATLGHFSLITEAWLNLFASDRIRGRVMALYGILPAVGYALGAVPKYYCNAYHVERPPPWRTSKRFSTRLVNVALSVFALAPCSRTMSRVVTRPWSLA